MNTRPGHIEARQQPATAVTDTARTLEQSLLKLAVRFDSKAAADSKPVMSNHFSIICYKAQSVLASLIASRAKADQTEQSPDRIQAEIQAFRELVEGFDEFQKLFQAELAEANPDRIQISSSHRGADTPQIQELDESFARVVYWTAIQTGWNQPTLETEFNTSALAESRKAVLERLDDFAQSLRESHVRTLEDLVATLPLFNQSQSRQTASDLFSI